MIATPQRRTSKVRKALRHPDRIKVVRELWLVDCISQWQRLDETIYLIDFGLAQQDMRNGTEAPFNHEDTLLSSEDEESGPATDADDEGDVATNGTNTKNPGLTLDIGVGEEEEDLTKYAPNEDEKSPITPFKEDWEGMDDELREFMGSDYEDSEDSETDEADGQSEQENESVKSGVNGDTLPERPGKRKRERPPDAGLSTDGEESDASLSALNGGSTLQRRKRQAMARTSSLTKVQGAGGEEQVGGADGDEGDADSLALEAEMEAELARELEDE